MNSDPDEDMHIKQEMLNTLHVSFQQELRVLEKTQKAILEEITNTVKHAWSRKSH